MKFVKTLSKKLWIYEAIALINATVRPDDNQLYLIIFVIVIIGDIYLFICHPIVC